MQMSWHQLLNWEQRTDVGGAPTETTVWILENQNLRKTKLLKKLRSWCFADVLVAHIKEIKEI